MTSSIGITLSLLYAVYGVSQGAMTVGDVILLQTVLLQAFLPLSELGTIIRSWWDSVYEFKELFGLLGKKPAYFIHNICLCQCKIVLMTA